MDLTNLHWLSAAEAAGMIRDRVISSVQLVEACLARVRDVDGQVQAWAFLDPEHALAQARAADELRLSGQPTGGLHGVPVGLKDIIDTADMPTENGSVLHAGRTPSRAAAVVEWLRAAGMVPLSLGSQTGGSTIRPGSYCGVYALKPTHGLVSRHGMFQLSRSLDHVGLFARTIEDLALLLEEVAGYDERDPDTHPRGRGAYRTVAM